LKSKAGTMSPKQSGQSGHASPAPCARTSAPSTMLARMSPLNAKQQRARNPARERLSAEGVIG
jgi:hypothetical protein